MFIAVTNLLLAAAILFLGLSSACAQPGRCYDQALRMLADEQGDWFIEKVLSHELAKILKHNTQDLEAADTSWGSDAESSEPGSEAEGPDGSEAEGPNGSDAEPSDLGSGAETPEPMLETSSVGVRRRPGLPSNAATE